MKLFREESGITLVEILVAATLMVVVLTAAVNPLNAFERASRNTNQQNDAQATARQVVDRMSRELRNSAGQTQFVEQATATDIVFQTVDPTSPLSGTNASNIERVRYCLNTSVPTNGVLWKQVQTWTTTTPPSVPSTSACPDAAWPTQARAAENITNDSRAVWTYNSSTLTDITRVHVDLYVDVSPTTRPSESVLSSGVYLRNQNKAPSASFTATTTGNKHVQLNGSGSSDPEGSTITYAWYDSSTLIGSGQNCDCVALATGNRSITLIVTDQSGLTGQATQTVNVQ